MEPNSKAMRSMNNLIISFISLRIAKPEQSLGLKYHITITVLFAPTPPPFFYREPRLLSQVEAELLDIIPKLQSYRTREI